MKWRLHGKKWKGSYSNGNLSIFDLAGNKVNFPWTRSVSSICTKSFWFQSALQEPSLNIDLKNWFIEGTFVWIIFNYYLIPLLLKIYYKSLLFLKRYCTLEALCEMWARENTCITANLTYNSFRFSHSHLRSECGDATSTCTCFVASPLWDPIQKAWSMEVPTWRMGLPKEVQSLNYQTQSLYVLGFCQLPWGRLGLPPSRLLPSG